MKNRNPIQNLIATNKNFFLNDGEENIESNLYKSLIGSLLYFGHTQPNIFFVILLFSRSCKPKQVYWGVAKKILRNLKGTIDHGLW